MKNAIQLNVQKLNDFFFSMKDKLTQESANELALKAIVLSYLAQDISDKETLLNAVNEQETQNPQAFVLNRNQALNQYVNEKALCDLVFYLSDAKSKGLLSKENLLPWIKRCCFFNKTALMFNDSVYELCAKLFSQIEGDELYIPFEQYFFHSLIFSQENRVFAEGEEVSCIPALLRLIWNNLNYQSADTLSNPAYIQQGKLQQFSKGFLAEPWLGRVNFNPSDYPRFAMESNNLQNYFMQQLFMQVKDFAIVAVPAGSLFSSVKSEENMREWLVTGGHLKSVISFPYGFIENTSVSWALMIFDFRQKFNGVQFINLKDSRFIEQVGKQYTLKNIDDLIDIIDGQLSGTAYQYKKFYEVAENGFVLSPERYVLNQNTQQALDLLQKYQTMPLGKLVDIIRPVPNSKLKENGEISVFEIQSGDLPEFGYIEQAGKENLLDTPNVLAIENDFLQAGDIIITVRGSGGKVGIVSEALLNKYHRRVIAGQTGFILRMKADAPLNSAALFMQLRSSFAQARLNLLSSGSVISAISIKDLKEFPIALFSEEKNMDLSKMLENENIEMRIMQTKMEMWKNMLNDIWLD